MFHRSYSAKGSVGCSSTGGYPLGGPVDAIALSKFKPNLPVQLMGHRYSSRIPNDFRWNP
jgi:hypothetical protein